jgi:hypothetical protein
VEFQQGSRWELREYSLDELKRHGKLRLSRSLPDLTNALHQGFMRMYKPQVGTGVC